MKTVTLILGLAYLLCHVTTSSGSPFVAEEIGMARTGYDLEELTRMELEPNVLGRDQELEMSEIKRIASCENDISSCEYQTEELVRQIVKHENLVQDDLLQEGEMLTIPDNKMLFESELLNLEIPDAEDFKQMIREEDELLFQKLPGELSIMGRYPAENRETLMAARPSPSRRLPKACLRLCGNGNGRYKCRNFLYDMRFKYFYQRKKLASNCFNCQKLCSLPVAYFD